MKYCIFLCDHQWNIVKIMDSSPTCPLKEGARVQDFLENPEQLPPADTLENQMQSVSSWYLKEEAEPFCSILCPFSKYHLVFLALVTDEQDFTQFTGLCVKYLNWAQDHLRIPYTDEYSQIQQMNNQLINSQRALMKTNHQLKTALQEIREANDTISLLERDELTSLYRGPAFYQKVRQRLAEQPDTLFDIIALDVDRFKLINEIFGRKTGDQLLQNLALFLPGLRHAEQGIFARPFADTFFVLMPAEFHFYEILHEEVSRYFRNYPLPVRLHGRIGVCSAKDRSVPVELLCDRARLAADTIDGKVRRRIAFYDQSLQERLIRETRMRNEVKKALDERQFHLYVQPKVDMRTGEIVGAESLVRWIHPEFGFIPPDQFIPLLEKEGEIYPLDKYVWEDTCRLLQQRQKAGKKPFPISVNVARGDLYQSDLQQTLAGFLKKYGLNAAQLHLEVTERAYVHDFQHIFQVLSALREAGFFIEMDDFGTGESSLAMVAEMPIDLLKLDRYFLVSAAHSKRHAEIVQFIIQLARSLDIQILAEGVETKEQADYLLASGCTVAQGYLYGKPMPAEEFLQKY